MSIKRLFVSAASAAVLATVGVAGARAEVDHITVAEQYGVSYLPLMIMQQEKLIQKAAAAEGVKNLKVTWVKFAGGGVMNEALLSDSLQFASGGVGPLVILWAKTRDNYHVKGVSAINSMPLLLNTNNPNVHSIKDFTSKDKIALPGVKVSIQAVTLEMAAAKAFGFAHYAKLDPLTVTMSHPDAMAAMASGGVDAHFGSPPFQELELKMKGVHTVLNSFDVLGGPATFNLIWARQSFYKKNPKVYKAFVTALDESIAKINKDKTWAAKQYLKFTHDKRDSLADIVDILNNPQIKFTTTPLHVMKYVRFLNKIGTIHADPKSWKDLFFPNVHNLPGS